MRIALSAGLLTLLVGGVQAQEPQVIIVQPGPLALGAPAKPVSATPVSLPKATIQPTAGQSFAIPSQVPLLEYATQPLPPQGPASPGGGRSIPLGAYPPVAASIATNPHLGRDKSDCPTCVGGLTPWQKMKGMTLGQKLAYVHSPEWKYDHRCEPDGCPTPIGCSNLYTELKFAFGSCTQFFGVYDGTRGHKRSNVLP